MVTNWAALRGRLTAVEGIDQAGKETVSHRLAEKLKAAGLRVERLAFPDYSTPLGQEIGRFLAGQVRHTAQVRQLLYAANRWERCDLIQEWLAAGATVLLDRYTGSGLAYGAAQGLPMAWMRALEEGLPKPDLVLLLDIPPDVSLARKQTARDAYESQSALLQGARDAYLALAREGSWEIIDATGEPEAVWAAVEQAVGRRL